MVRGRNTEQLQNWGYRARALCRAECTGWGYPTPDTASSTRLTGSAGGPREPDQRRQKGSGTGTGETGRAK